MRKKKIAAYIGMIISMLALSMITPMVIDSISSRIAEKIRGGTEPEKQSDSSPEDMETEDPGVASLSLDPEKNKAATPLPAAKSAEASVNSEETGREEAAIPQQEISYYEEPVYKTAEEENAANRRAYQDMTEKLKSLSEATADYREHFDPVYEELKSGIMNAFIDGREAAFYEDIANYCFGRYNTSKPIALVRFIAVTEDTAEKMTVILEFFSADEIHDDTIVPGLTYCSYNKTTNAFIFYESGG